MSYNSRVSFDKSAVYEPDNTPITIARSRTTIVQTYTISSPHDGIVDSLTRHLFDAADIGANLVSTKVTTVAFTQTTIRNK